MNSAIVLVVTGPIARETLPRLSERMRALLESNDADLVICDVGAIEEPDAVTIDALARLQLTARRMGRRVEVFGACSDLTDLLSLVGLSKVVPPCFELPLEPGRQIEQGKPAIGIEKEGDPADPIA